MTATLSFTRKWIAAVLAQLAVLGWMVAWQERALAQGEPVVLEVRSFDPFDPLAGRYLALRLAHESIDAAKVEVVDADGVRLDQATLLAPYAWQPAFIELERKGAPRGVRRVVLGDRAEPPDAPYLRARSNRIDGTHLDLDCGLDRYYIPADGRDPTRAAAHVKQLTVLVRLSPSGGLHLEELLVDGTPYPEWNRSATR